MSGESVNKKCIESLIKAGAFDEFEQTRSTLLASFEGIIDTINDTSRKTMQGQVTMFDLGNTEDEKIENMKYNFTTLKEFDEKELLSMEKEMLGIYIRTSIRKIKRKNTTSCYNKYTSNDANERGKQFKWWRKTSKICWNYNFYKKVEDLYGSTEIIVFDSCYSKSQNILLEENIVLIDGRLSIREDEPVKIVANSITEFNGKKGDRPLFCQTTKMDKPKTLTINITNISEIQKDKLRGAIKFFSGDKNNIAVQVNDNGTLKPCGTIYLNEQILNAFKEIVGEENIEVNS